MLADASRPVPAPLDELIRVLPFSAQAELKWFPEAFRQAVVRPLSALQPTEFLVKFHEVVVPGVRLLLRASKPGWALLQHEQSLESALDGSVKEVLQQVEHRLESTDVQAADALREAYAWLVVLLIAVVKEVSAAMEVEAFDFMPDDAALVAEMRGPGGSFMRGLILTFSAYEALTTRDVPPPAIRLWSEEARREVHAAANVLRSLGVAVPSSLPAQIEDQAWRRRGRSALFRSRLLPVGTLGLLRMLLTPKQLWLFGSRAKGTFAPDSDWDVLAVVSDKADLAAIQRSPMLSSLRRKNIDLTVATESEFEEGKDAFGSLANIAVTEGIRLE